MSIFSNKCFTPKPINQAVPQENEFKRALTLIDLIFLGIAAIIGGGVFVLTGKAASQYAGSMVIASFMLAGIAAMFTALCYAELTSRIPVSGGVYNYAFCAFGEFPAWIVGTVFCFAHGLSITIVAQGCSKYIQGLLDVNLITSGGIDVLAFILVMSIGTVLAFGVSLSSLITNILVVLKLIIIIVFIIIGLKNFDIVTFAPAQSFQKFGISGIINGAGIIFLAYAGVDSIAAAVQEAKKPQSDAPKGIVISIVACLVLYGLASLAMVGSVHYSLLNVVDPAVPVLQKSGFVFLSLFIKLGIVTALLSMLLAVIFGLVRAVYNIAKDGLFPKIFASVHKKYKTPFYSTFFVSAVLGIISSSISIEKLMSIGNLCHLTLFMIVCLSVLAISYNKNLLKNTVGEVKFECPLKPFLPIVAIIIILFLWFPLFIGNWKMFLGGILVLSIYYLVFGQNTSNYKPGNGVSGPVKTKTTTSA